MSATARRVPRPPTSATVARPSSAVLGKTQYKPVTSRAVHSEDTAAAIFAWAARRAARKKSAYVVINETPVEEVTTPARNAKARSAAIVKRIESPASRKRGCATLVFQ